RDDGISRAYGVVHERIHALNRAVVDAAAAVHATVGSRVLVLPVANMALSDPIKESIGARGPAHRREGSVVPARHEACPCGRIRRTYGLRNVVSAVVRLHEAYACSATVNRATAANAAP